MPMLKNSIQFKLYTLSAFFELLIAAVSAQSSKNGCNGDFCFYFCLFVYARLLFILSFFNFLQIFTKRFVVRAYIRFFHPFTSIYIHLHPS